MTLDIFWKGYTFVFDKYSVFYDEKWIVQIALALIIALTIGFVEKRIFLQIHVSHQNSFKLISAIPFSRKYKVRATGAKYTQCGVCNRECFMGPFNVSRKYYNTFNKNKSENDYSRICCVFIS